MLRFNRILEKTNAEGPGTRLCIWVQGCHNRCKGCFATETWSDHGGTVFRVSDIVARILALRDEIEGVTFLGGEPFEQAAALAAIAESAHEIGLTVLTFTGKTYEWLIAQNNTDIHRLLDATDVLIDGPFRIELQDFSRPLVGSANQRFLFLTDRYRECDFLRLRNKFEVRIASDGSVRINGMGDINKLEKYIQSFTRGETS